MNTSHTPGPWDDASKYPEVPTVRIFSKTHYIASVGNSDDSREQTEANARLIAAAPELLKALERVIQWMDANDYAEDDQSFGARAAIAKATKGDSLDVA